MDENKLILDVNGEQKEYEVLFKFDNKELERTYIAYTDNSKTNGKINIIAGYIDIFDKKTIKPVTSKEELDMFNEIIENAKKSNNGVTLDAK